MIQVGARINGEWARTPSELVAALATRPGDVEFWSTSPFTQGLGQHFPATDHDGSLTLDVVGPNPWLNKRWHLYLVQQWHYSDSRFVWQELATEFKAG